MATGEAVREKRRILLDLKLPRKIRLRFHDYRMSFVEGMLSRGGRRLFDALCEARRRGCSFDAWSERIDGDSWREAFAAAAVDAANELHRERGEDESFPWDHSRPGPSKKFLLDEWRRAQREETTPRCGEGHCNNCGLDPKICATCDRVAK